MQQKCMVTRREALPEKKQVKPSFFFCRETERGLGRSQTRKSSPNSHVAGPGNGKAGFFFLAGAASGRVYAGRALRLFYWKLL